MSLGTPNEPLSPRDAPVPEGPQSEAAPPANGSGKMNFSQAPRQRFDPEDTERLNRAGLRALPALRERLKLEKARVQGREFEALNPHRCDSNPGSFRINLDTGKWADFADGEEIAKGGDFIGFCAYLGKTERDEVPHLLARELETISEEQIKAAVFEMGAASSRSKSKKVPIVPVPDGAPEVDFRLKGLGAPSVSWLYQNAIGERVCYVGRWDCVDQDGKRSKKILPVTYCRLEDGTRRWCAKGIPGQRPLYRLPEIFEQPDTAIIVTEGEKTADAGQDILPGTVVTTPMHGAQSPHLTDWSPVKDRRVVISADNDEAGRAFAEKVARLCCEAGAAEVSELVFPAYQVIRDGRPVARDGEIPKGWDLADAKAEGWTTEHVVQAFKDGRASLSTIEKSAAADAETTPADPGKETDVAQEAASRTAADGSHLDIRDYRLDVQTEGPPPDRKWLVGGSLPRAIPAVLYGPGGVGKSMAVLDLALKVATRERYGLTDPETFLGSVPKEAAGAVIFITLEDDKAELHRRIAALDAGNSRQGAPIFVMTGLDIPGFDPTLVRQNRQGVALTDFATSMLDEMISQAKEAAERAVSAVILDPAGDLVEGSEDDAALIKPLMRRLREIAARHDCTVLLIGHSAKGQLNEETIAGRGMRGSGAWVANARWAFGLWRPVFEEAKKALSRLGQPTTAKNIERVVFGKSVKVNQPGLVGRRTYLQDLDTGLIHDCTDGIRSQAEGEWDRAKELLLMAIREASELGLPYQISGQSGLYERRADLPPPMNDWGDKKLRTLGNELLDEKQIEKCRAAGSQTPRWLDVPGGGYAKGETAGIEEGSLSALREAARRKAPWE